MASAQHRIKRKYITLLQVVWQPLPNQLARLLQCRLELVCQVPILNTFTWESAPIEHNQMYS